ncbi:MAG: TRAP transporter large permease subunit [Bacteroidia bacterium]|nr:TRAP transporter large permease subunit [Bacteroidia bacterium]MDW8015388.1 TRAP transporter large permease subunit [Bacteroidia bacterium]
MKGILLLAGALILILLGVPLFVLLGGLSFGLFAAYEPLPSEALLKYMLETLTKPALLSIPLYILAGALVAKGRAAQQLVGVAQAWLGWLPGGLAVTAILACMIFGAISGSSPVTMVAIGSFLYPAMRQAGYPESLALGSVTVGGSLGILIPPSIPMIVYGIVTRTDIEQLFLASIIPGLWAGGLLIVVAIILGIWTQLPRLRFSLREALRQTLFALPALGLPVVVLGGIYTGLYNITEAAGIAVLYLFLLEGVGYRSLRWSVLRDTLAEATTALGSILAIVLMAALLSYFLLLAELPFRVVEWVDTLHLQANTFILAVVGVLLIAGMVMDVLSAILIFAPAFLPAAQGLEISPIFLGVIFILSLEIGYLTPPVGLNLFVAMGYFQKTMGRVVQASFPFLIGLLATLGMLIFLPPLFGLEATK